MGDDTILCACGCGTVITRLGLNGKPRKYKQGHQCLGRKIIKDERYWGIRLRKLHTRASLCLCGCGEKVLVSMRWLKEQSQRGDRKKRSVWLPKYKEGHMPLTYCACGCGTLIPSMDSRNHKRSFVPGHAGFLKKGIDVVNWKKRKDEWGKAAPFCACGCGVQLKRTEKQLRSHIPDAKYLSGHGTRRGCVLKLTQQEESIVYGCLLGDFSITIPKKTARLGFTHCIAQKLYALHKIEILKRLSWWWCEFESGGYKKGGGMIRGTSACMPILNSVWETVRPFGEGKQVTSQWLDHIDERALAYWYMDDGSCGVRLVDGSPASLSLHTEGFTESENLLLASWLRHKGYRGAKVAPTRGYFYLYLPKFAARKFLADVSPFVHSSMGYKLGAVDGTTN